MKKLNFIIILSLFIFIIPSYSFSQEYEVTDIGDLEGGYSRAMKINNLEQIVGWSTTLDDYHIFLYENGEMRDLGNPGGYGAYNIRIRNFNNAEQVLGSYTSYGDGEDMCFCMKAENIKILIV